MPSVAENLIPLDTSLHKKSAVPAWRGLNKSAADECYKKAQTALAAGELETAKRATLDALLLHPGLEYLYRHLGLILAKLENNEDAEQCYRGVIPSSMNAEWFSNSYTITNPAPIDNASQLPTPGIDNSASRIGCYEPFERRLRAPLGIKPPTDRMFDRGGLTSRRALVDHVPDGALWFDGFNRAVLNNERKIIKQHSRGNPDLIKAATKDITARHIEGRAFFVGNRGYNNYYHWMLDILPSLHLCEKSGFKINDQDHVIVFSGSSSFQKATLEHLGFQPEQIIQMNQFSPYISADELVVPHYSNGMATTMGDWVPRYLQSRFLSDDCQSPVNNKHLYLARAKDARNGRSIGNEAQMIDFLESRGYLAVYPENYTITEQAALFAQAESIMAAHGAGLTNIAFCKPGTKIIELYGEYMETCYWALSEICNLTYINHFCSQEESQVDFHARSQKDILDFRRQGFSVNLEELDQLLNSI